MRSMRARLLLVASLVLMIFLVLAGVGLDQAIVGSALQAQQERMQGLVYALIGAAEPRGGNLLTIDPQALPDPRLRRIDSGVEALIFDEQGQAVWHSPNLSGALPKVIAPGVGNALLREEGQDFVFSFGIRWLGESNHPRRFTVALIEDRSAYAAQVAAFRRILWFSLGASGIALLLVQFFLLRWGLAPVRALATEISQIETGERGEITADYPTELTPLADNLNAMIRSERNQQQRYRNALGDLAHSLKTPLAVLRGLTEDTGIPAASREQLAEQVARMQDISDHQLRRAGAAGRRILVEPVPLRPLADKVLGAMAKVYADRKLTFTNAVDPRLRLRADQGDLYEILGNLLDNAAKLAKSRVSVAASSGAAETRIDVDDDGPGFPAQAGELLKRGVRADTRVPGQGIGLATVADIVHLDDGDIELLPSPLGGARVRIRLPR